MKRQLIIGSEGKPSKVQHKSPCSDCPFAWTALRGWLGRMTAFDWIRIIQGEGRVDCHTKIGPQCAGAAIFRANVCKVPRDRELLRLEPNKIKCFANYGEFLNHHVKGRAFDHWGRGIVIFRPAILRRTQARDW